MYGVKKKKNWGLQDNMNLKYGLGEYMDQRVISGNAPFIQIVKAFIILVTSSINPVQHWVGS